MSYLKNRIKAFSFAISGLRQAFATETHLKLYLVMSVLVVALGLFFGVSPTEWLILALAISLVICFELFNSALEKLCDLVMPEKHTTIKYVKDVAAGAVLLACVFALMAGLFVFLPYLLDRRI